MCLHVAAGPFPAEHLHLAVEISHLLCEIRYRSIITSFLHAWTRVAPREIFKYSRSVFAWTTISRGVEHTRLVYHHAWLLHAWLLHA